MIWYSQEFYNKDIDDDQNFGGFSLKYLSYLKKDSLIWALDKSSSSNNNGFV